MFSLLRCLGKRVGEADPPRGWDGRAMLQKGKRPPEQKEAATAHRADAIRWGCRPGGLRVPRAADWALVYLVVPWS